MRFFGTLRAVFQPGGGQGAVQAGVPAAPSIDFSSSLNSQYYYLILLW